MEEQDELFFSCPYCWTQVSIVVESLYGAQTYIEDCERCCQPIEITYHMEEETIVLDRAERAQ